MKEKNKPQSLDFEIINVKPLNKHISECEIKVFHIGQNRNGSYISKAVGNQIANSLPRSPIVALYNEEKEDYEDHGEELIINSKGIKFNKKTIPYGAVDQNAPVVWKKLLDKDGNEQEYMVAKGFLWTGRYPHLQSVLENPKGQSMEFFEESVRGDWAKFDNKDAELFVFSEADVSALCILGDDVEPCFADATVGKPEFNYSLEKNEFKKEFNAFMFELNEALEHESENTKEGGTILKIEDNVNVEEEKVEPVIEDGLREREDVVENPKEPEQEETKTEELEEEPVVEEEKEETEPVEETEEAKPKVEEPKVDESAVEEDPTTEGPAVEQPLVDGNKELESLKDKFALQEKELADLKVAFTVLKDEKDARDLSEKEEICNKFSILGEEALKPLKENLNNYTAVELEKELSVLAFQKGISFNLLTQKDAVVTPNPVNNNEEVPAWVRAVEKQESENY